MQKVNELLQDLAQIQKAASQNPDKALGYLDRAVCHVKAFLNSEFHEPGNPEGISSHELSHQLHGYNFAIREMHEQLIKMSTPCPSIPSENASMLSSLSGRHATEKIAFEAAITVQTQTIIEFMSKLRRGEIRPSMTNQEVIKLMQHD